MSSMQVTIRPADAEDADALARVWLESRRAFLGYAPLRHSDEDIHQWIAHTLIPEGGARVVEREGRVVGMYAIARRDGCGWLDQFYLLPGQTGRGIGGQMLSSALSELSFPVRLYCFRANEGARRFYERHGFVALRFGDGSDNEEGVPDILYGLADRRFAVLPSGQRTSTHAAILRRR
jgi:RimJ/RimL family protein N-acetyltransferase